MIKFNEVTWYSKLAAVIFFIGVLPTLTFYLGTQYQIAKFEIEMSTNTSSELDPNNSGNEVDIYQDLTQYKWIWKETHNGVGPDSLSSGKITPRRTGAFTITFSKDGKVSGTTDCNGFGGTYTLNGGELSFGPLASTLMFCENSQESEFLAMLKKGGLAIGDSALYLEHSKTVIFDKGVKIK